MQTEVYSYFIMTPATPPRSSNTRYNRRVDLSVGLDSISQGDTMGSSGDGGLITPTTVAGKPVMMGNGVQGGNLGPLNEVESPIKWLKSPEYTPCHKQYSRRRSFFQDSELQPTSRVLFPLELKEGLIPSSKVGKKPFYGGASLCSKSLCVFSAGIEEEAMESEATGRDLDEEDLSDSLHVRKYAKQVPGTPTDKIITFQLAKDWNNNSAFLFSSEDEDHKSADIKKVEIPNIFISNEVATTEIRRQRKDQLLKEAPELETSVSFLNKKAETVYTREFSSEEIQLLKPKMLFSKELELRKLKQRD